MYIDTNQQLDIIEKITLKIITDNIANKLSIETVNNFFNVIGQKIIISKLGNKMIDGGYFIYTDNNELHVTNYFNLQNPAFEDEYNNKIFIKNGYIYLYYCS